MLLIAFGTYIGIAHAADAYPPIICTGIFGCGQGYNDVLFENALPLLATVLVQIAGGGAVIAIVIAGSKMLFTDGDDGKASAARQGILYALGGLALAITASSIVSFVSTENIWNDASITGLFGSVIGIILALFNTAFGLVVIYAGIKMIIANGKSDEFNKSGRIIVWAVIGAIIVNLAKVIVQAFLSIGL
jgi:FtsH-binding integral membrane protein